MQYDYYGPDDNAAGQEPGALKDMLLVQNGVVISSNVYAYDDAGRLYTDTVNGATKFTYTYVNGTDLVSNVAMTSGSNTVNTAYGYNSTDLLSGMTTTAASSTLYNAGYTYNADITRATESVSKLESDNSTTDSHGWTPGYDSQQQLTSVTNTSDSSTVDNYSYNAVGARTDLGTINALNQYSTFSYNPNGDITDDGTDTYTWDAKDRLTSITPDSPTNGAEKDTFAYDGQDRRIGKTIYTWNSTSSAWTLSKSLSFIYDNRQIVAEVDATTNDVLQTYAWSTTGTLQSITDYTTTTPKTYAAIAEPNGSIQSLVDVSSGLVVASWRYDAWGNVLSSTGSTSLSPFGWQGLMSDSGSNYLDASREINSRDRVFLSLDTAGQQFDANAYRADQNDPVNLIDPTGTAAEPPPAAQHPNSAIECHRRPVSVPGITLTDANAEMMAATARNQAAAQARQSQIDEQMRSSGVYRQYIKGTTPQEQQYLQWQDQRYGPGFFSKLMDWQGSRNLVALNQDAQFQRALDLYLQDERQRFWGQAGYGFAMRLGDQAFRDAGDGLPTLGDLLTPLTGLGGPLTPVDTGSSLAMSRPRPGAGGLIRKANGDVVFQGMTVQVQEDLSHLSTEKLQDMKEFGTSGLTEDGEVITLHHVRQQPSGPLWEIVKRLNDVSNRDLHPYGNSPGSGLTLQERADFNEWRTAYWKARAAEELNRRHLERNGGKP